MMNELKTLTGCEPMRVGEAFEAQHAVQRPNRRTWQAPAVDGGMIVTIWADQMNGNRATAHVNANAADHFAIGDEVRAVIVLAHTTDQPDGSKVRAAFADHRHLWRVCAINGTALSVEAVEAETRESLMAEAQALTDRLQVVLAKLRVKGDAL